MDIERIVELARAYDRDRTLPKYRDRLGDSVWEHQALDPERPMWSRIWAVMNWVGVSATSIAEAIGFDWRAHESEWVQNWENHAWVRNSDPVSVLAV